MITRYFELPGLHCIVVENCTAADVPVNADELSEGLFKQFYWNKVEYVQGSYSNKLLDKLRTLEATSDDMFTAFMCDEQAWDMYITGPAGTGKTTKVTSEIVPWCTSQGIKVTVCAYTHRACDVLAEKMPSEVTIKTLHSFLAKCPIIDQNAKNANNITVSRVAGKGGTTQLLVVDEYGMIGERDLADLRSLQDPDYTGKPQFKVLWLGDPNQLPPVGDVQAVRPQGNYQMRLTEIHRTSEASLLGTLSKLVSYIEGKQPEPLEEHECFIRGQDIAIKPGSNDVLLAYTNKRVQELNAQIACKDVPEPGDILFSPTTHKTYTFLHEVTAPDEIMCPYAGLLARDSKYKTLEFIEPKYNFALVTTEEGECITVAYIFGHSAYNEKAAELKADAAKTNAAIEKEFKGYKAAVWAKANNTHKLARARAKAWREFLGFDKCVMCLDFPYARTVHKSQGSTFDNVYIDMDDLYKCAERDFKLYLRLLYVAISRARFKVITN